MKYGNPKEIENVEVRCGMDAFDNAIREFGVINACEWFGHRIDSDFTKETIKVLCDRTGEYLAEVEYEATHPF